MYGQGNYAPHFAQGPRTSMSPCQQPPLPPPPPLPPFQQGPPAPRPPIIQQGPLFSTPHVGQPGPPVYQHATPAPVHQGAPVTAPQDGVSNPGQSYFTLPPPPPLQAYGNTQMPHAYHTGQQNSQWAQNVHRIPPPVPHPLGPTPTGPSSREMLQPPPPPRVLPPSQGQGFHEGSVHPLPPGGMQGLQHNPLPLPPPPPLPPGSNFYTPDPYGSFLHSKFQDSHINSLPPPPPPPPPASPPVPPPLPPSSPPPDSPPCSRALSSTSLHIASEESGPSSNKGSGLDVTASLSVQTVLVPQQIVAAAAARDECLNPEGGTGCEMGSLVEDDLPSGENLKLDLPPPPPKPTDDRVFRRIEILCQFIAKHGPEFEDMTRQKEFGNPEFNFLFDSEPGSEAAAAHEYFVWMKKKCRWTCELPEEKHHRDSPLRHSGIHSSLQPDNLMSARSLSSTDSDMDMEDDITQSAEEQWNCNSFESLNRESASIELDRKEQLHAPQIAVEQSLVNDSFSGNFGSSESVKQEEGTKLSPDYDHSAFGKPFSKVDGSVMYPDGVEENPLDSNIENFFNPHENLRQSSALATAAGISSEKVSSQFPEGTSAVGLLQDYASDNTSENDDEPRLVDVSTVKFSPSAKAGAKGLETDMGCNFQTDLECKTFPDSVKEFVPVSESAVACSLSVPSKYLESSVKSESVVRETDMPSIVIGEVLEVVDSHGNQASFGKDTLQKGFQQENEGFQQKNALGDGSVDALSVGGKSQKETVQCTSRVDEFGRLVREGASDSDSDDSHYIRTYSKRGRSWSRSRSPHDRRRRRSPRRRKEKRSRSPSWSPRKRRSRSKSPPRRGGEFGSDKIRRDKGQQPDCFDFLRGKCYRGALCRYLHHQSDKGDRLRRYKSKQQYHEIPPSSKNSDFCEEIGIVNLSKSLDEQDEVKNQEMQGFQDISGSSYGPLKGGNDNETNISVSVNNGGQSLISGQEDVSLLASVGESERYGGLTAQVQEAQEIKEELVDPATNHPEGGESLQLVDSFSAHLETDANAKRLPGDTSYSVPFSIENSMIQHSQVQVPVLQNASHQPNDSSTLDCSPMQTSTTSLSQLPISEPHSNQISSTQSYTGMDSISKPFSSENLSSQSPAPKESFPPVVHHPSNLPPHLPSYSQDMNVPFPPQLPRDHNVMPPTVKFPFHSASIENYPPYQAPLPYQHFHFPVPPNASWTSLPPPPPPHPPYVNSSTLSAGTASYSVSSTQFQQTLVPLRNDFPPQTFVRPYSNELPSCSQVGEIPRQTFPPTQEPDRPSSHVEDFRSMAMPVSNPMSQPFGGPGLVGEGRTTRVSVQDLPPSNSFSEVDMHPQPMPLSRESPARRLKSFAVESVTSSELDRSSQSYPYLQQPAYGMQHPASNSVSVHLGDPRKIHSTMSRHTSDFLNRNNPSHVFDFGGSRISNHYNPYASTFDQPLSLKFSSNVFNQEKDTLYSNKYGDPFSLSRVPVDGQEVGSLGSRNITSSLNSARAVEQVLPRSGGDQYDPLFDSIEQPSNSFRKSDRVQKFETTDDSDILLRLSGSNKPLDVEENNKQKGAGAIDVTTSLENDEFGETADAEVGAVENGSPSSPMDDANPVVGEIEIDQVKTPGKSKKSKDSRSMKLFKTALANFVKDVLKPSWRQGNMSKEAFKTIVRKTVDKVSGAMKSHHIPKSQTKINHYIDSSQRKLTKLVMGYVDKYVKV